MIKDAIPFYNKDTINRRIQELLEKYPFRGDYGLICCHSGVSYAYGFSNEVEEVNRWVFYRALKKNSHIVPENEVQDLDVVLYFGIWNFDFNHSGIVVTPNTDLEIFSMHGGLGCDILPMSDFIGENHQCYRRRVYRRICK